MISRSLFKFARNTLFVMLLVLVVGALSGAGWYYRSSRFPKSAALVAKPSPVTQARAVGVIVLGSPAQPASVASLSATPRVDTRPVVTISVQPLDQFDKDVKGELIKELSAAYPQVSELNREVNGAEAAYRDSAFQFLELAEQAPAAQQPALLLAADFILGPVWCPSEQKEKCDPVRNQFAEHKLSFPYAELDGGSYYRHDLLWRIWNDYPNTDWGERAFVMLLSSGWDPSGTCSKGADKFRAVILQGESFLEQHPGSANRPFVVHLVGQAYATWWSLSNDPTPGMEDYVDPKLYQEGSEQARLKAISNFEQVLQFSPDSKLGEYSRQVLPALREKQLTSDAYRFFCVYD